MWRGRPRLFGRRLAVPEPCPRCPARERGWPCLPVGTLSAPRSRQGPGSPAWVLINRLGAHSEPTSLLPRTRAQPVLVAVGPTALASPGTRLCAPPPRPHGPQTNLRMSPPRPAARLTVPDASSLALEGRRRRGLLPVLFCGGRPRVPLPILTGRPRPSGSRDPGSQSHAGPRQVPGGWGVRVIAAQASSPPGPPFQPLGRRRAGSKTGSWGPSELPAEAACEPPALTRHARSGCVTPREPPVFTRLSPSDSWAFLTGC